MKNSEFVGFTHDAKQVKKPKKAFLAINLFLSLLILTAIAFGIYKITELFFTNSNTKEEIIFPKLELSLADVTIEQIDENDKHIKYPGNSITITTADDSISFDDVEIKGRGNQTLERQPKRSYQIKFNNQESLLGYNKNKKWVLLTSFADYTSLRNDTAFYLEKLLNEQYTPDGNFVELFVDGRYHGLYYLARKIEISKNSVDLSDPSGILVEVDNIYGTTEECHRAKSGDCLTVKDLVNKDNESEKIQSFVENFDIANTAIENKDFEKLKKIIDVDSFAKYYLLSEFTTNPDAYSTSFFMYRDKENDKIYAGPGWDFDLAFGNKTWGAEGIDNEMFHSPLTKEPLNNYLVPYIDYVSTIIYNLMDIPEFEARVKEIFRETMSGKKEELLSHIKSRAEYIRAAALRDQERWKLKTNFDEEVEYLLDWVSKRYDHFEETYGTN